MLKKQLVQKKHRFVFHLSNFTVSENMVTQNWAFCL